MPEVHDVGPVFVHTMSYPSRKFPFAEVGRTQETDYPYRIGTSLVVRCPGTAKAIVIGLWRGAKDEVSALYGAIGARDVGEYTSEKT